MLDLPLTIAVVSLAVTCLAAVAAKSLAGFSRHQLEEACRRRQRPEMLREIVERHPEVALGVECLRAMTLAGFVASATYWLWFAEPEANGPGWRSLLIDGCVGAVVLAAVEIWIPWALAQVWAEPFLVATWPGWKLTTWLTKPLVVGLRLIDKVLERTVAGRRARPNVGWLRRELHAIITSGRRSGLIEEETREMVEAVIDLGDVTVAQVMTPRIDMESMSVSLPWDDTLRFLNANNHSRVPVYGKNRDDILGVLHAKDVLAEMSRPAEQPRRSLVALLRRPFFVPESKKVDELLREFQRTRNHMAIVLDEYGGVSGLVTIEDILEEVVGEIVDEHDDAVIDGIKQIDARTSEVLARVNVCDLNERLGLRLAEEREFATIGGYVFTQLGHVPQVGESIVVDNLRFTVLDLTRRRIERVRIEVLDPRPDGAENN